MYSYKPPYKEGVLQTKMEVETLLHGSFQKKVPLVRNMPTGVANGGRVR